MPFTRRFVEQPLYHSNFGNGELTIVEGYHIDGEDLSTPLGVTIYEIQVPEGARQEWEVAFDWNQEREIHSHVISHPSDPIFVPEPSTSSALLVGMLVLLVMVRRNVRT